MKQLSIYDLRPVDGRKSFYGKAQIIRCDGWKYLRSYDTIVCGISPLDKFVRFWWSYSHTTQRHINAFRAAYGLPSIDKTSWKALPVKSMYERKL